MTKKIKVGNLVSLKSGGPQLTVRACQGKTIEVDWFDGNKAMSKKYLAEQLVSAEKAPDLIDLARRIAFILSSAEHQVTGKISRDFNEQIKMIKNMDPGLRRDDKGAT